VIFTMEFPPPNISSEVRDNINIPPAI